MLKNILATVGILAVVGGIAIWQFGFLSQQAKEAAQKIDRATAVARAEKALSDARGAAAKLDEKARSFRVKAETLEIGWKRAQARLKTKEEAMRRLAEAAKNAGLPAPSARETLADEQRASTLKFGDKTIGAADVYSTLDRWNAELKEAKIPADATRQTIDRLREASAQILEKKAKATETASKIGARLADLAVAKDLAQVDKELAEMEAGAVGIDVGEIGETLAVLQGEIDELTAAATVYNEEAKTSGDGGLNPEDVVAPIAAQNELDALWDVDESAAADVE